PPLSRRGGPPRVARALAGRPARPVVPGPGQPARRTRPVAEPGGPAPRDERDPGRRPRRAERRPPRSDHPPQHRGTGLGRGGRPDGPPARRRPHALGPRPEAAPPPDRGPTMTASLYPTSQTDARLVQALDAYLAALQAGRAPDRDAFLAEYPELADDLTDCLASLEFIRQAAVPPLPTVTDPTPGGLGDLRLVREVGRGGMGVVYEAEQVSLGRRVALKVLPFAAALDAKQLQRFKNEAQAAAHLRHNNIVPVHYVGCERGVHFYAMQFIDGQTLATVIEQRRQGGVEQASPLALRAEPPADTKPIAALTTERSTRGPAYFRSVAQLGVQAAEALHYAH